jgi:hypothetical protein
MEEAVAQLEGRYKGAAEAATQTFAGGLEQLKNQTGETQEALGKLFGELAGGDRPFSMATDAARGMATFFGSTLVVALSELRATFSETMANIAQAGGLLMELIAHWLDSAGKLPIVGEKFKELAESLRGGASFLDEFSKGMNTAAAAQREAGNVAATTAGKTQEYVNQQKKAAEEATKAAAAAKAHAEALKHQQEALKNVVAGLKAHNDELAKSLAAQAALLGLLGPSAGDASIEMGRLADSFERNLKVGELSDAQLATFITRMKEQLALGGQNEYAMKAYGDAVALAGMRLQETGNKSLEAAMEVQHLGVSAHSTIEILAAVNAGKIGTVATETKTATKATNDWGKALQDLSNLFNVLGIKAESVLGRILGSLAGLASGIKNLFGKDGAIGGFKGFDFSHIGDSLKKIDWSKLLTGLTGAIGAGAAIFGALKNLFGGDPLKKVGEEAGRTLGMSLSHSLLETISKTAKDLGISVATAALLHLTDALKETGKAASGAIPQMMQLFAIAKQGGAVGAAAVDELGKAFTMLKTEAEAGSAAAARGMVQLIQEARKAGQVIPEIAAAVSKAMEDALSGLADFTKNFKITSPEDARAEAFIFASTFWAEVQEKGEVAAATAMLPAWQAMQDSLKAAGIDPAVVAEILAPMQAVFDALADDGIKKVIEGLDGASRAVKGLADAGYMTQGAFQGLEQVAGSSVDQIAQDLIGKGVPAADAQRQALQLCAPQLAQLGSCPSSTASSWTRTRSPSSTRPRPRVSPSPRTRSCR